MSDALLRIRCVALVRALALCLLLALWGGSTLAAETNGEMADSEMDGDAIYRRILDNRFSAYIQKLEMKSGDRGGNALTTKIKLKYKNYRDIHESIVSKSIAKYEAPQDVRHLGYLVINKLDGSNDEFIYQPSSRRVRRINLRGEAVFGTDFSFEDIIPQEFEDGTYSRLPDAKIRGIDCYAVQVIPTEKADSEYSKFVVHADREHFVPIQTDYWDTKDVHIKTLEAVPSSIEGFTDEDEDGPKQVWISKESKILHLKLETWTELKIKSLKAKPNLRDKDFSQRKLTSGR